MQEPEEIWGNGERANSRHKESRCSVKSERTLAAMAFCARPLAMDIATSNGEVLLDTPSLIEPSGRVILIGT